MSSYFRLSVLALTAWFAQGIGFAQPPAPGLYGIDLGPSSPWTLYTISPTTGAKTLVGPLLGYGFFGPIAFAPDGRLFSSATDILFNPKLLTLSPSTGAPTLVAPITGLTPSFSLTDFAVRPDGALFAAQTNGNLYTINTATGVATLVGNTGISLGGLAFSGSTLYQTDATKLYTVNQSTAALTQVAVLTFDAGFGASPAIRAMEFDPVTGRLFALVFSGGLSFLANVNPSSGAVALIGPSVSALGGLAIPNSGAAPVSMPALSNSGLLLTAALLAGAAVTALRSSPAGPSSSRAA